MAKPVTDNAESTANRRALAINPLMAKAGAALAAYEVGTQLTARVHTWWTNRNTYKVSVDEDDPVFEEVHDWLLNLIPSTEHKDLKVITGERSGPGPVYVDDSTDPGGSTTEPESLPPIRVVIDDASSHRLLIEGHRVKVSLTKPENATSDSSRSAWKQPQVVTFWTRSPEAQAAVVSTIDGMRKPRSAREPVLNMVTQWGSWRRRNDLPKRTLESVFLPTEQKQRIVDDIAQFLGEEEKYNRLGMPYHRGYLWHGPPGTGKTSLAKAIATHFRRDLWYVPLADLESESGLLNLIAEVRAGSVLLLEDIDCLHAAVSRQNGTGPGLTTGSLLNALDGVATPHGLISIVTTNHFEQLDPGLTRAGRMDRIEELGLPSPSVVADMLRYFYGVETGWANDVSLSQAEIVEIFKRNDDVGMAEVEIFKQSESAYRAQLPE